MKTTRTYTSVLGRRGYLASLMMVLSISLLSRANGEQPTTTTTTPSKTNSQSLSSLSHPTTELLSPIEIKGYKFFNSATGTEFIIRGIDYYPRPNSGPLNANSLDLFTNEYVHIWTRDIQYLKELGVNSIRLYAVDPTQNHDAFMCALNEAGIYVIVALAHDCPTCAVTRDSSPTCYPTELKTQGQAVINAFSKYPNVIGFSAGNEVNHYVPLGQGPEWNGPCQKQFLYDMRKYVHSCSTDKSSNMRKVPIGLISADNDRTKLASYYNCIDEETSKDQEENLFTTAEWYGLNAYVMCDAKAQTYDEALGLILLQEDFQSLNYSIPVILTEYGCLSPDFPTVDGYPGQRTFLQTKWLYNVSSLRDQLTGGYVFEYSMERENANGFGIGYLSPEDCDDIDVLCEFNPMPSYYYLQKIYQWEKQKEEQQQQQQQAKQASPAELLLTIDTFDVSEDRISKATCPSTFPALDSFQWITDDVEDLECPSKHILNEFTCPASGSYTTTTTTATSAAGNITKTIATTNNTAVPLAENEDWNDEFDKRESRALIICLIITLLTFLIYFRSYIHKTCCDGYEKWTSSSTNTATAVAAVGVPTSKMTPVLSSVSIYTTNSSDNEADGLISNDENEKTEGYSSI